jgi:hypothetical protein
VVAFQFVANSSSNSQTKSKPSTNTLVKWTFINWF